MGQLRIVNHQEILKTLSYEVILNTELLNEARDRQTEISLCNNRFDAIQYNTILDLLVSRYKTS